MSDQRPGIRPRPSLGRQLDLAARQAVPAVSTALLILACGAPLPLAAPAALQLCVALSCVFFWSVFRPASMPPVAVFILGLLLDLLGFAPLGVNLVVLLCAQGAARRWRRALAGQGSLRIWLAFVGIAGAAACLGWVLTCLLSWRLYPPGPLLLQAGMAAGIYPALAMLLTRANRTVAEPRLA